MIAAPQANWNGSQAEHSGGSILVVEDDPGVRPMLQRALARCGYAVQTASDCRSATDMMQRGEFDVLLADVNLPDGSGLGLLSRCRRMGLSTQVILMTGRPDLRDAVQSVRDGAFNYLAKPVSPSELREMTAAAVRHSRSRLLHAETTVEVPAASDQDIEFISCLGSGAMGRVLLVRRGGKRYAMKVLRPSQEYGDTFLRRATQRFLREGKLLARIHHPGVVRVLECGNDERAGGAYIMMEYVQGQPLTELIGDGRLSLADKLRIIHQLADALAAVHRQGVRHRDVKPGNVVVTDGLKVKLIDFGVARTVDSSVTVAGELVGSPAYMAPEAFERADVDHRADIFSLGVLSYELLTGSKPFLGDTLRDMMLAITQRPVLDPRDLAPDLPDGLAEVVCRMLEKSPDKRFQSAADVAEAFGGVLTDMEERPSRATSRPGTTSPAAALLPCLAPA